MNDNDKETKIVIETADRKKTVEFSVAEFNEFNPLTVTKIEQGKTTEVRIIKFTPTNKKLIMS